MSMQPDAPSRSTAQERYDRDGYVVFRDVLDPGLIVEASGHVE